MIMSIKITKDNLITSTGFGLIFYISSTVMNILMYPYAEPGSLYLTAYIPFWTDIVVGICGFLIFFVLGLNTEN